MNAVGAGPRVGTAGRGEDSTAGEGEAGNGNNKELGDTASTSITHTRIGVKERKEQLPVVVHDLAPDPLPRLLLPMLLDPLLEPGAGVEDSKVVVRGARKSESVHGAVAKVRKDLGVSVGRREDERAGSAIGVRGVRACARKEDARDRTCQVRAEKGWELGGGEVAPCEEE